jgi:hypothetical protein
MHTRGQQQIVDTDNSHARQPAVVDWHHHQKVDNMDSSFP